MDGTTGFIEGPPGPPGHPGAPGKKVRLAEQTSLKCYYNRSLSTGPGSDCTILAILYSSSGNVMKQFFKWKYRKLSIIDYKPLQGDY